MNLLKIITYITSRINIFIGEEELHKKCNKIPLKELQIKLTKIDDSLHKIAKKDQSYKKTIMKRKCSTKKTRI